MSVKAKFYGTRGSIPVCDRDFQEFGGNTTCVRLMDDRGQVAILDAGSGIRNLGKDLIASAQKQVGTMFIAFSHFHWDHIQGFPFFSPAYDPRRHFTISAFGRGDEKNLKRIFAGQMQQEYFPLSLDQMGAKFDFLVPGGQTFENEDAQTISYKHNHPGGAYTYRIETRGKVFVFCTDIEHGDRALTHHDPDHNDEFLLRVEEECQKHFPHVVLAREKMEIEL